jgi:probable phosphoglycerate mutase
VTPAIEKLGIWSEMYYTDTHKKLERIIRRILTMRLLFIRHGDPDYAHDNLTEKGRQEALLLAAAAKNMNLGTCYVSPLGRAQATARYCLDATGKTAEVKDWLHEFPVRLDLNEHPEFIPAYSEPRDKNGAIRSVSFWDMIANYWVDEPVYMDPVHWREAPVCKVSEVAKAFDQVSAGLDELLAEHGYVREGGHYRVVKESDETLTFFCHFAIASALIAHIWNISPFTLWFHTQMVPTAVTELVTEERLPGYAHFRSQRIGDISHLYAGHEEPSFAGRFCELYSNQDQRH